MKKVISLIVLFVSIQAFAQTKTDKIEGQAVVNCEDCQSSRDLENIRSEVSNLKSLLGAAINCENKSANDCMLIRWLQWKHESYAANCKHFFIDEKGKLGDYSKEVSSLILENISEQGANSVFVKNNPDFEKYCPGFKDFTISQKVAFHGWIFELTAFPESTCRVQSPVNHDAPQTKAVCMYQLEDKPDIRAWRSARFQKKRCAVSEKELLTMKGCTGCAMDEYTRKMIVHGTPFGSFDEKRNRIRSSYWASHNPLHPDSAACFEKYRGYEKFPQKDPKTGKALWMQNCEFANHEWRPRYLFFKRIQRFPLCKTELSKLELEQLSKLGPK